MIIPEQEQGGFVRIRIFAILALLLTFIVMVPNLQNDFTNWDDLDYVVSNKTIQSFTLDNLKKVLTEPVLGNFHPVTMLSFMVESTIFGDSPTVFHGTNILLHLVNTLLLFWLILLVSGRAPVAFITALLFGIHPMHVESVAWISERKDLLYTLFLLAGLISYWFFIVKGRSKMYILTLVFFLLSVLSKSAAVIFPVLLLLIDYYLARKIDKEAMMEKLPFFALALVFGLVALRTQAEAEAIVSYGMLDRLFFASYGLMMYIFKLFYPANLSALYPFPKELGNIHYMAFLFVVVAGIAVYLGARKNRVVLFGIGFFLVSVALVIQLLPFGEAIMADRYTYLPYVGLFFIIAMLFQKLLDSKSGKLATFRMPAIMVGSVFILFLMFTARERIKVWENSKTLWEDVISKHPKYANAYNSLANYYYQQADVENTLKNLDKALLYDYNNEEALNNRGGLYYVIDSLDWALADLDRAIELKPDYGEAYLNRGNARYEKGMVRGAKEDYDQAIRLMPNVADCFYRRAVLGFEMKALVDALQDLNKAIFLEPGHIDAWNVRGDIYMMNEDYNQAHENFTKALDLSGGNATIYYKRGHANFYRLQFQMAVDDFTAAIRLKPDSPDAHNSRANAYSQMAKYKEALEDVLKAKELGFEPNEEFVDFLKNEVYK